ncbi:hypothetical protein M2408_001959 [Sphingobacterium sp. BIGb0165]|nr:hypothetical protein [Sphingobacterium sp. BIGb0165]
MQNFNSQILLVNQIHLRFIWFHSILSDVAETPYDATPF